MPHFVGKQWVHRYWFITGNQYGEIVVNEITENMVNGYPTPQPDGTWQKRGGYRREGLRIYTFERQRDYRRDTYVINTRQECYRFAAKIHEQKQAGKTKEMALCWTN